MLISCFLFNIIGYKLFFYYQLAKADSRIEARIEKLDVSEENLFTVKIPIRLPYHTDWKEFESVGGEMTYNNTSYKYVSRKVLRDTLILICIEHCEKTQIEKTQIDYSKIVNGHSPENSKKQVAKQVRDDYYQKSTDLKIVLLAFTGQTSYNSCEVLKTSSYHQAIDRPPSLDRYFA